MIDYTVEPNKSELARLAALRMSKLGISLIHALEESESSSASIARGIVDISDGVDSLFDERTFDNGDAVAYLLSRECFADAAITPYLRYSSLLLIAGGGMAQGGNMIHQDLLNLLPNGAFLHLTSSELEGLRNDLNVAVTVSTLNDHPANEGQSRWVNEAGRQELYQKRETGWVRIGDFSYDENRYYAPGSLVVHAPKIPQGGEMPVGGGENSKPVLYFASDHILANSGSPDNNTLWLSVSGGSGSGGGHIIVDNDGNDLPQMPRLQFVSSTATRIQTNIDFLVYNWNGQTMVSANANITGILYYWAVKPEIIQTGDELSWEQSLGIYSPTTGLEFRYFSAGMHVFSPTAAGFSRIDVISADMSLPPNDQSNPHPLTITQGVSVDSGTPAEPVLDDYHLILTRVLVTDAGSTQQPPVEPPSDVMLKSVYDTNGNGKVDSADYADQASNATTAATATNAQQLGGVAAAGYLRTTANTGLAGTGTRAALLQANGTVVREDNFRYDITTKTLTLRANNAVATDVVLNILNSTGTASLAKFYNTGILELFGSSHVIQVGYQEDGITPVASGNAMFKVHPEQALSYQFFDGVNIIFYLNTVTGTYARKSFVVPVDFVIEGGGSWRFGEDNAVQSSAASTTLRQVQVANDEMLVLHICCLAKSATKSYFAEKRAVYRRTGSGAVAIVGVIETMGTEQKDGVTLTGLNFVVNGSDLVDIRFDSTGSGQTYTNVSIFRSNHRR